MFRLNFTSRVLGGAAASKLVRKMVTQTLRSDELLEGYQGVLEITLDEWPVGTARKTTADTVKLADLTIDDARRGGFDSISELASALRRAGYRFKPIDEYQFLRVKFEWVGGNR